MWEKGTDDGGLQTVIMAQEHAYSWLGEPSQVLKIARDAARQESVGLAFFELVGRTFFPLDKERAEIQPEAWPIFPIAMHKAIMSLRGISLAMGDATLADDRLRKVFLGASWLEDVACAMRDGSRLSTPFLSALSTWKLADESNFSFGFSDEPIVTAHNAAANLRGKSHDFGGRDFLNELGLEKIAYPFTDTPRNCGEAGTCVLAPSVFSAWMAMDPEACGPWAKGYEGYLKDGKYLDEYKRICAVAKRWLDGGEKSGSEALDAYMEMPGKSGVKKDDLLIYVDAACRWAVAATNGIEPENVCGEGLYPNRFRAYPVAARAAQAEARKSLVEIADFMRKMGERLEIYMKTKG